MSTLKITRSKLIQQLIDSQRYDDLSREDLIEVLRDSDRMYFEDLDLDQLQIEASAKLGKKIVVLED